jgi:hypothetical protein
LAIVPLFVRIHWNVWWDIWLLYGLVCKVLWEILSICGEMWDIYQTGESVVTAAGI